MSFNHVNKWTVYKMLFCTELQNVFYIIDEEKENNRASKPHSTPATLEW